MKRIQNLKLILVVITTIWNEQKNTNYNKNEKLNIYFLSKYNKLFSLSNINNNGLMNKKSTNICQNEKRTKQRQRQQKETTKMIERERKRERKNCFILTLKSIKFSEFQYLNHCFFIFVVFLSFLFLLFWVFNA